MSSTIPISHTTTSNTTTSSSTVYGTTPGGTPRISYSRDQLLNLASSPLSRSPPKFDLPAAISRTPKADGGEERERFDGGAAVSAVAGEEAREEDGDEEGEAFSMDL